MADKQFNGSIGAERAILLGSGADKVLLTPSGTSIAVAAATGVAEKQYYGSVAATERVVIGMGSSAVQLTASGTTLTGSAAVGVADRIISGVLGVSNALIIGTGSNQVTLTASGSTLLVNGTLFDHYLNVPTGGGATTPNQAGLASGLSTIEIMTRVNLTSITSAGGQSFLSQEDPGNARWYGGIDPTGHLDAEWVTVGAAFQYGASTAVVPFSAGQTWWQRVVMNVAAGTITFYTSPDGAVPTWTQLGTSISGLVTTGLQTVGTPALVRAGIQAAGAAPVVGRIYRSRLLLASVSTLDMDFSLQTPGNGPWTATTAETWTRVGTAAVV